jgi:hypothetical protein
MVRPTHRGRSARYGPGACPTLVAEVVPTLDRQRERPGLAEEHPSPAVVADRHGPVVAPNLDRPAVVGHPSRVAAVVGRPVLAADPMPDRLAVALADRPTLAAVLAVDRPSRAAAVVGHPAPAADSTLPGRLAEGHPSRAVAEVGRHGLAADPSLDHLAAAEVGHSSRAVAEVGRHGLAADPMPDRLAVALVDRPGPAVQARPSRVARRSSLVLAWVGSAGDQHSHPAVVVVDPSHSGPAAVDSGARACAPGVRPNREALGCPSRCHHLVAHHLVGGRRPSRCHDPGDSGAKDWAARPVGWPCLSCWHPRHRLCHHSRQGDVPPRCQVRSAGLARPTRNRLCPADCSPTLNLLRGLHLLHRRGRALLYYRRYRCAGP